MRPTKSFSSACAAMVKKVYTKFAVAKKSSGTNDSVYRSPRIYLPTKLTDDSMFPFKEDDLLLVKIDGRKLVVQKVRKALGPGDNGNDSNAK